MLVRDALTERELELVKLAALGMKNRHIAWRLGLAEDTVKHWFVVIFDKTGVRSRLELVIRWVGEQELVRSPPTLLPLPNSPVSSSQKP